MPQCPQGTFLYPIGPGETLWMIAERYNTSVYAIMALNPGITPNNLFIGQLVCIMPGIKHFPQPAGTSPTPKGISKSELDLRNALRKLWEEHAAWTRMTIISMASDLPDKDLVTNRLLRNAPDMGAALRPYYGEDKANRFAGLLKDHLVIAAQLVAAAKAGKTQAAQDAEKRWYENADEIAAFLNSINPYWPKNDFMRMLHEHLALTKKEAVDRLNKNYSADIAGYDKIESQVLSMADTLSEGIVKQFPDRFTM